MIKIIITPPTSFSQSRRSIDVTWRHTLSPRYTQRQPEVSQSPDARLVWAFIVRDPISKINIAKKQEKNSERF